MSISIKIIGINLLVFVAYVALITSSSAAADKGFNIAIGMGMCVVLQVALNALVGFICLVLGKRNLFGPFLISAGVLIPIGFVTWLILLSIFG